MQDAAESELQLQWDQYLQNRSDMAPYRESGTAALGQLSQLLGLETPQQDRQRQFNSAAYQRAYEDYNLAQDHPNFSSRSLLYFDPWRHYNEFGTQYADAAQRYGVNLEEAAFGPEPTSEETTQASTSSPESALSEFFASPGYNFNLSEALRANEARAAARGRLQSTATDRSNARYASNLASNEYLNYVNQLFSLSGMGQITNQNLMTSGNQLVGQMGNALQNQGAARASSYLGNANTLNNAANNYMNYNAYTDLATMLYGNNPSATYNSTNGYGGQYDDFYSTYGNM
ncbi:MAG: hypothetical protein B6D76_03545 [gamma proteobacterium symbiont of Stewartia floridana]|nr:MAG: hypothetical protein B6D76_03545 [gamma proteobacterium symbiont of Stewartia floridana]RLW58997.1 MAG: hypothetical protein B6D75_12015 [gamma proteobacterium symbiont of Stewartia floridana]